MEPDRLSVILRALVYVGAIGACWRRALLFELSAGGAACRAPSLRRQILLACWLLILVEPLRYVAFQLAIAEGDPSVAFAPAMRWMGLQSAVGQASAARLIAAIVLLVTCRRWPGVSLAAAAVMIASFGLEGHTVSNGNRLMLAPLLLIHFAAICWWIGTLYPLLALIRQGAARGRRPNGARIWPAREWGSSLRWLGCGCGAADCPVRRGAAARQRLSTKRSSSNSRSLRRCCRWRPGTSCV